MTALQPQTDLCSFLSVQKVPVSLASVLVAIAKACETVSQALKTEVITKTHSTNKFGDKVLSVDLLADDVISKGLQECPAVGAYCSEERPELTRTLRQARDDALYCVAFDPLDGSSVIPTNFAVGSIFGVWHGCEFVGQRVGDIAASVVVIYGPRTELFVAHRIFGSVAFLLDKNSWVLITPERLQLKPKASIFAPGNLRAVKVLPWYREIVTQYMDTNTTLRYTGCMVPDVCQILIKKSGIFMTPETAAHKVKLRVLFECGPMAFLIHCAGGYATTGSQDYLTVEIRELHQRSPVAMGSVNDVRDFEAAQRRAATTAPGLRESQPTRVVLVSCGSKL